MNQLSTFLAGACFMGAIGYLAKGNLRQAVLGMLICFLNLYEGLFK